MSADADPESTLSGEERLLSGRFAVVMAASLAYFTAIGGLIPTIPRFVEGELGGGGFAVGVGAGVFAVSAALLRPWVGRVGDTKGRRILAVGGAGVVAVSIFSYSLVTSMPLLVLARLLTGAGEAAMFVGVATAAQDLAPDHRRGEAASYFSVALYGGLAVGPPLGEALVPHGFTTVWLVMGASAAAASLLSVWIPKGRTVAIAAQRKFLQRDAVWPGVLLLLGIVPFVAFSAFVPLYADNELGLDSVGSVLGLYAGSVLVVRIFGARIPDRIGWHRGSAIALVAVSAGVLVVAVWPAVPALYLAAVGLAVGMSLLYPSLFTAVMASAPEDERSHAVGTFSVFFDLATGFGAALVGIVVSLSNERGGFAAAGLLAASGLLVQAVLRDRIGRRPPSVSAAPVATGPPAA